MKALRTGAVLLGLLAGAGAAAAPVMLEGEIYADVTAPVLPPSIDTMWQFSITQLVADGVPVKQGEVVVAFDGGQLMTQLTQKQSALKEKHTQHERLQLDLAEREKQERLATEQRAADLDKARRKAEQPAELIGRNDYAKLVIERNQAAQQLALAERREALAAEQRRQERRLLDAEIAQLEAEVADLQQSLTALSVPAARDGIMIHRTNFQGEKFDVGAQVWRGLAVAEIPDLSTLAVRATLAERDLSRIRTGQRVRISVEGGAGASLDGHVREIGRTVRSKSRVQPVPVVDVIVAIDGQPSRVKPGQPVRVELLETAGSTAP